jgi:rhodanese-related sulfurtransferase
VAALAALASTVGGCQDTVSDKDIIRIGVADVQRLSKDSGRTMILDPRPADQYARGHLPGAVNVPLDTLPSTKGTLRPDLASPKVVIVYGENPGDGYAVAATKRLLRAGQGGARLFSGGLAEWRGAGLTVNAPAATPSSAEPADSPK